MKLSTFGASASLIFIAPHIPINAAIPIALLFSFGALVSLCLKA